MLRLFTAFLFISVVTSLPGQDTLIRSQPDPKWEIGLQLGTSAYGGDLIENDIIVFNQASPAAGLLLRRRLGQNFGLRLGVLRGQLRGDDAKSENPDQAERQWSFESPLTEGSLVLEFDLFGHRRYRDGRFYRILSPYIFGGIGYAVFDPEPDFANADPMDVAEDLATDFDKGELVFPVGIGLRYDVSPSVALALEFAPRFTNTDYLDGISKSANPREDDTYSIVSAQLWLRLGKQDSDGDGIADDDDACPDEAGPETTQGCPDRDMDGIADRDDDCPDAAGVTALAGCPDQDGDGITDAQDACPDEAGSPTLNGCPDRDSDGIADAEDDCPDEAGTLNTRGCPDRDGDGIADATDPCPDRAGTINGCPDSDNDGIADPEDDCPDEAGTLANNGCPEEEPEVVTADTLGTGITQTESPGVTPRAGEVSYTNGVLVVDDLHFETARYDLLPQGRDILDRVARLLRDNPDLTLLLEGHADSRGTDPFNQTLSENRASAARDYLVSLGIDTARLQTAGRGESDPQVPNTGPQNWYLNRRVEVRKQ